MRNIKLTMEYDGGKYSGWQRLGDNENTIQGKLENVLHKMTNEKIEIIGSGRTDAGVHALNQVANFKTRTKMTLQEIRDYCNQYLPKDIVIKKVQEVDERFHSRYNVKGKKYLYRIWKGTLPTVFDRKYTYHVTNRLNIEAMEKAAQYFIGTHDFKAFSSGKSKKNSTVREIFDIEFTKKGSELDILFYGDGFLYNMVRIMVGTLIEVGEGKRKAEEIESLLEGKVRENAGITAPAQALFLYEVEYK